MSEATPGEALPGLAVSQDGLTLELDRTSLERGTRSPFAFRIGGEDGEAVRNFDVEHDKRMHFIAVLRDLTGFQHLHPQEGPDGTWRVPLRLSDSGSYRVFADFATNGVKHSAPTSRSTGAPSPVACRRRRRAPRSTATG
jgi:hypothetical protein